MQNPIDGIVPDFSIFGAEFTEWWQKLFGGLWAILIIVAIVFCLLGLAAMSHSDDNPHDYSRGRSRAIKAFVALVGLVGFGVLIGAITSWAG